MNVFEDSEFNPTVSYKGAKIRFSGAARGYGEWSHDIFMFQLPNRRPLYGEWKKQFAPNGNDYDVVVSDVGLLDPRNVAIPGARRESFSLDEKNLLEELIRKLFDDPEARKSEYSLQKFTGEFPGKISFNM